MMLQEQSVTVLTF